MRTIFLLILAIFCGPRLLPQVDVADSLMCQFASRGATLQPIEGFWQFAPEESAMAIVAQSAGRYDIIVLDCPDVSVAPGTLMGQINATAKNATYEGWIYTSVDAAGRLSKPKNFTITLADDGYSFTLHHYVKGVKVNLWRVLPYMFRHAVRGVDTRPQGIDGCYRVFPTAPPPHFSPVIL